MNFDNVSSRFGDLPYMRRNQASELRDLIRANEIQNVLELGFFAGKSSAYFAAILADEGRGHLTTIDLRHALKRDPNIHQVLDDLGLQEYVTVITAHRSYTWELAKMLRQEPRPTFDLCYLDGGHTWDVTGWGFVLVDLLLKPGGWIVFDDLNWSISQSLKRRGQDPEVSAWNRYPKEERDAAGVRMVWDLVVPEFGYSPITENKKFGWGIARKPWT